MWITYFIFDIIIPFVMLIAGVLSAKSRLRISTPLSVTEPNARRKVSRRGILHKNILAYCS